MDEPVEEEKTPIRTPSAPESLDPAAASVAPTDSPASSPAEDAALRQAELRKEYLVDVRRAAVLARAGAFIWPVFVVYDYLQAFVLHEGDFAALVALRIFCEIGIASAAFVFSRKEPPTEEQFDRITFSVLLLFTSTLAGMCVATTGFASIYVAGNLFVALGNAFVPRPFWPSLGRVALTMLPHPIILGVGVIFSPRLAAQIDDPRMLAVTLQYVIVAACLGPGIAALSAVYAEIRKTIYESRSIGRYRLQRLLGRGGTSEIWAAYHIGLQREIALKILEPHLHVDEGFRHRFEREVKATASLTHPNTIRVFDFGATDEGLLYYAMELLEGENLTQFVKRRPPIAIARAVHLVRQAAFALAEAHAHGIVHRDVKPENLFVTEAGGEPDFIKVLDFGIAVVDTADRAFDAQELAGSATTISPEVVRGESATTASDVYALGVVLYFLLARGYPFGARRGQQAYDAHREETPAPPSERRGEPIPAALESLVLRSLAKDPSQRPADARVFAEELDAIAAELRWNPRVDAPAADRDLSVPIRDRLAGISTVVTNTTSRLVS